jgi:hypothetical protein
VRTKSPEQRRQSEDGFCQSSCARLLITGRAGAAPSHHRDDDVPRDGDDVLAGAGGGRDEEDRPMKPSTISLHVRRGCLNANEHGVKKRKDPPSEGCSTERPGSTRPNL